MLKIENTNLWILDHSRFCRCEISAFALKVLLQSIQVACKYSFLYSILLIILIIPTLFRKSVGDIVIRPSVRYVISSQTAGQNPTKFGEWLAYTSGACKSMFIFGSAPRGPGEGSKGQILTISNFQVNFKDFYAKICTYTQ